MSRVKSGNVIRIEQGIPAEFSGENPSVKSPHLQISSCNSIRSGLNHLGSTPLVFYMTLFLIIAITNVSGYAQNPQETFNEGARLLNETRYNEALAIFRQIEVSGWESGALYLNMGVAATRIDSLGLAKYYFTKAKRYEEVTMAADEGLNFVEWELGRRGARLPQLAWTRITTTLLFELNHISLIITGIIIFNIGAFFFAVHWLRAYLSKTNRFIGISLMSIALILITFTIIVQMNARNFSQAVQLSRESQIRVLPSSDSEIIQTGYEGFLYIVDEKQSIDSPGWLFVRMSNGARGWVEDQQLLKFKNY